MMIRLILVLLGVIFCGRFCPECDEAPSRTAAHRNGDIPYYREGLLRQAISHPSDDTFASIDVSGFHTGKLLYSHHSDIPAVYQLAHFLEKKDEPLIVYTWEESRVFEYLSVPFRHEKWKRMRCFQWMQDIILTGIFM